MTPKYLAVTLFILLIAGAYCAEDYYKLLGVPRNADESQIKKAFKKLSLKYHPDRNRGNEEEAKQQFVKIGEAYEVLSDPEKKQVYDQYGEEGLKRQQQGGHPGHQGNFDDIFSSFFGGGGGRRRGGGGGGGFQFNFGGGGGGQRQRREQTYEDVWEQSDVFELGLGSISMFYRRQEVWLILFWKSNQKNVLEYKDVYREVAEKLYGIIRVAAINCHEDYEDALCEDFEVYDTPKILVFPANSRLDPIPFGGKVQYSQIAAFAFNQMESFVKLVNDDNYESFINEDFEKTKVLLFTAKKTTPPLLKALSKDFKSRVVFGEVRQASKKMVELFKITNFPTILVISEPFNHVGVAYEGEFKKDQIAKFLREHSSPVPKKTSSRGGGGTLQQLTPVLFQRGSCSNSDSNLCALLITDRDDTSANEKALQSLKEVAPKFAEDPIKFFFISSGDLDYSESFTDINSFPSLFVVKGKRKRYTEFSGQIENQEDLSIFFESIISGTAQFKKMKDELSIKVAFDYDL